jgi:hypothetical protein
MQSNERTPRIRKLALNRDRFLLHRFLLAGKGIKNGGMLPRKAEKARMQFTGGLNPLLFEFPGG